MQNIMVLVLFFLSLNTYANTAIETMDVLRACSQEYIETSEDMKQNLLSTSPWNYDNDYEKSQVIVSEGYDFTDSSFKVKVFIDVEGLRDLGYIYEVEPVFFDDGSCSHINTHYEEM